MKRTLLFTIALLVSIITMGKDIKTVTLTVSPQMHCQNCENKIKDNLRYVKGVKAIETCIASQTVTVEYDADKTSTEKIVSSLKKANYTATETQGKPCCGKGDGECCKNADNAAGSCCKESK